MQICIQNIYIREFKNRFYNKFIKKMLFKKIEPKSLIKNFAFLKCSLDKYYYNKLLLLLLLLLSLLFSVALMGMFIKLAFFVIAA